MCEEVEPNVFYEPRTAIAPFAVLKSTGDPLRSSMGYWDGPHKSRAEAEEAARRCAEHDPDSKFYVVGCVSISSVPKPVPLKASTRALV